MSGMLEPNNEERKKPNVELPPLFAETLQNLAFLDPALVEAFLKLIHKAGHIPPVEMEEFMQSPNVLARKLALQYFVLLNQKPPLELSQAILNMCNDQDSEVRYFAFFAASRFGLADQQLTDMLIAEVFTPEKLDSNAALSVLCTDLGATDVGQKILGAHLGSQDLAKYSITSLLILAYKNPDNISDENITKMGTLLTHTDFDIRHGTIMVLSLLGERAMQFKEQLDTISEYADTEEERELARSAICEIPKEG